MHSFDIGENVECLIGAVVEFPGREGLWRLSKVLSGGRVLFTKAGYPISLVPDLPSSLSVPQTEQ